MLRLDEQQLPEEIAARLAQYQAQVDEDGDYPTRVESAKRLFALRHGNATFRQIRNVLARMCAGAQRCGYCEDSVGDEVEHIQPKDLYPEMVFVWENYLFSCGPCNTGKSNKFSIINKIGELENVTRRRGDPVLPPRPGLPAFVNPRRENPLDFLELEILSTFAFLPRDDASVRDTIRASFTIEALKLNRDVLLRARANAFGSYRARLAEYERTGSWRPSIPTHGDPPFRLMATPRTGVATQPVEGVSGIVG